MTTKTIKTSQYLEIVKKARACIAELPDKDSLNPQRIADDIVAKCDGDMDQVEAAFEAYRKQVASAKEEAGQSPEDRLVAAVLRRRASR